MFRQKKNSHFISQLIAEAPSRICLSFPQALKIKLTNTSAPPAAAKILAPPVFRRQRIDVLMTTMNE